MTTTNFTDYQTVIPAAWLNDVDALTYDVFAAATTAALARTALGLSLPTTPKVGFTTRDLSTASGNQSITGVGFQPNLIIIIMGANGAVPGSIGFATANNQANIYTAADNTTGGSSSNVINYIPVGGTAQQATVTFDSDGFTLAWTKTGSPTGTANIAYLCMKF